MNFLRRLLSLSGLVLLPRVLGDVYGVYLTVFVRVDEYTEIIGSFKTRDYAQGHWHTLWVENKPFEMLPVLRWVLCISFFPGTGLLLRNT